MTGKLLETWEQYYRGGEGDTLLKDRNFFKLEVETISLHFAEAVGQSDRPLNVVELGSGTGFLADFLLNTLDPDSRERVAYTGVDFSREATAKAEHRGIGNATFACTDFLSYLSAPGPKVDIFVVQRSIMALTERDQQRAVLLAMKSRLASGGTLLLSEGTARGFQKLNDMRRATGQEPLQDIWHCLYISEEMVSEIFEHVAVVDFASTYWLLTRVVYPFEREPRHNTSIHDLAAEVVQCGDYGLVKLIMAK